MRTRVLDPAVRSPAVAVPVGTFTADQSTFADSANDLDTNDSDGVLVSGGTVTVTRSAFHGFGSSGVRTLSGTANLNDDTFQGNIVGVTGDSGSTTVVRTTFQDELASLQGTVSIAGSALGSMLGTPGRGIVECGNATVTDLGYNLATDATCGFTAATSHESVTGLHLDTGLADGGGPVPTVAILSPSSAVDTIPAGA